MADAKRRRLLPPTFEWTSKLSRAAASLQKFWRFRKALRRATDPLTQESLTCRDAVLLVEPNGCEQYFSAMSLSLYFLRTGRFTNPLNRRELHRHEVDRVTRRISQPLARAVTATFFLRHRIASREVAAIVGEDLAEAAAGTCLQSLLSSSEKYFGEVWNAEFEALLEDYELEMESLAEFVECERGCGFEFAQKAWSQVIASGRREIERLVDESVATVNHLLHSYWLVVEVGAAEA